MPGGAPSAPPMPPNASIFNPAEASVMSGQFNPNMTVRDALGKLGIDVDGPATQLVQFTKQQMQNRTMSGKLGMNRPPAGPQRPPMAAPPQGAPSPEEDVGGMEGLMSKLRA